MRRHGNQPGAEHSPEDKSGGSHNNTNRENQGGRQIIDQDEAINVAKVKKKTSIEAGNPQTILGEQPKEETHKPRNDPNKCQNVILPKEGNSYICQGVLIETSRTRVFINMTCMKCKRGWQRLV